MRLLTLNPLRLWRTFRVLRAVHERTRIVRRLLDRGSQIEAWQDGITRPKNNEHEYTEQ